ncbi:MAG: tRNA lysidine(34) synthetase TilS [Sulfuricellaceae bacterium]
MANSKKLLPDDLQECIALKLTQWAAAGRRLTLALSGGVDSMVLLDILAQLRATLKFQLSALYVNHQISPNAPAWGRFCAEACMRLGVPFIEETVALERNCGASLEALARAARYRVFACHDTDFIALAQHLDDQAETLLLQLLRGAGMKGLSAMPDVRGQRTEGRGQKATLHHQSSPPYETGALLIRPMLDVPRGVIVAYAGKHGLSWVEDESNRDVAFDRNFLRRDLLPVLEQRFPAYRETFARSARHFAEAAGLLDDLAALDADGAIHENRLDVAALRRLSPARARNLLRYYLDGQRMPMPSAVRLDNMLSQLMDARSDARVHIRQGDFELRRYRDIVYALHQLDDRIADLSLPWHFERELALPFGRLNFERRQGAGISLTQLAAAPVTVRYRRGGERMRPACGRPTRSLKNLLQETAVPPWQRERLPLLYCGDDLVFVPEVGIACAYRAKPDEDGMLVNFNMPYQGE